MPPESISISVEPPMEGFRSKGMFLRGDNLICGEADDMAAIVEAREARILLNECRFYIGHKRKHAHDAEGRVEEKRMDELSYGYSLRMPCYAMNM